MALADELAYVTATELAGRIRRRELSPVEVVDAFIERIEARNPTLNAFVYSGFDDARQRACEAEQALVSGTELGVLHGVPTAIKDLFDFQPGWPATFGGIRALKDFTLDISCAFAERIQRAGAIVVGKTNSPIMGFRGTCDNYLFGPSRNPFDTSKNTGGSSGGSAAAVADGLLPLAEGTDGSGSIRIPAAWCGVYGYKASFGRVPYVLRPNAFGGITPFLFEGPITRTVEDAALALDALAGYDSRDPFSLDSDERFTPAVRRPIDGWRIAYSPDFDVFPVDKQVVEVVGGAVQAFEQAGAHVEEVRLGINRDQRELSDLWCRLIMPINVETFENFKRNGVDLLADHREDFPPEYLRWVEEGYRLSALDLSRDQPPADPRGDLRRDPAGAGRLPAAGDPDAGLSAGGQRRRRQHRRPEPHQRRGGRPADRLVPHLLRQLLRPPCGVDSRGLGRGAAAGWDAVDRPPLRRRGCAGGKRRLRAAQALAGHIRLCAGRTL
jgi:amidase